jgi:hypothetical protein
VTGSGGGPPVATILASITCFVKTLVVVKHAIHLFRCDYRVIGIKKRPCSSFHLFIYMCIILKQGWNRHIPAFSMYYLVFLASPRTTTFDFWPTVGIIDYIPSSNKSLAVWEYPLLANDGYD